MAPSDSYTNYPHSNGVKKPPKIIAQPHPDLPRLANLSSMSSLPSSRPTEAPPLSSVRACVSKLRHLSLDSVQAGVADMVRRVEAWLQETTGCSPRISAYATRFVLLNGAILLPLAASTVVFTAVLVLFSVAFICSAVFASLAVVIILVTLCLFACLAVVASFSAGILGLTACATLVVATGTLLALPVVAAVGIWRYLDVSYLKHQVQLQQPAGRSSGHTLTSALSQASVAPVISTTSTATSSPTRPNPSKDQDQ